MIKLVCNQNINKFQEEYIQHGHCCNNNAQSCARNYHKKWVCAPAFRFRKFFENSKIHKGDAARSTVAFSFKWLNLPHHQMNSNLEVVLAALSIFSLVMQLQVCLAPHQHDMGSSSYFITAPGKEYLSENMLVSTEIITTYKQFEEEPLSTTFRPCITNMMSFVKLHYLVFLISVSPPFFPFFFQNFLFSVLPKYTTKIVFLLHICV